MHVTISHAIHDQVTIFSKSYCPYCMRVKALFDDTVKQQYTALELDTADGKGLPTRFDCY